MTKTTEEMIAECRELLEVCTQLKEQIVQLKAKQKSTRNEEYERERCKHSDDAWTRSINRSLKGRGHWGWLT